MIASRKTKALRLLAGVALVGTFAVAPFVAGQSAHVSAAAADHFKATGPNRYAGGDDAMRTPQDFEAAAAAQPNALFSLCRKAPFNQATTGSTTLYSPFTSSNVDTIVNDSFSTYVDGTRCAQPENEQNIAVNPTDKTNVVTASNDYRDNFEWPIVYVSHDGGASFSNIKLPGWDVQTGGQGNFKQFDAAGGDPVLAYAPNGTLYYAALEYSFAFPNRTPSGVAVAVSHDGGSTWSAPRMVAQEDGNNFFNDKEWIAVGPDGTVYVTWTRFNQGAHGAGYIASPIVMSQSRDGGMTWSSWVPVSDKSHPYNQGSSPVVAPNGTIYVAYEGGTPSTGYAGDATIIAKSTDHGQTFTNTEIARVYDDYNCYPIQKPGGQGRQTLSYEQFRINSYPSLAIDPTTGKLAVAWADDQANSSCGFEKGGHFSGTTENQVKLATSSNGTTWTTQTITPTSADAVFPAVGANAGRVVVGYYTRDFSPAASPNCAAGSLDSTGTTITWGTHPVCLDYAMSSSSDNFATENRVTTESSNPYLQFAGAFIGDYTGVAVDSTGNGHAVWTDFRGQPGLVAPNEDTMVGNGL